ncbi:MAG: hypothetical protein V5B31_09415 [Candidatus Accumulibacter propinquus]|uniref:hypothetical protein n=1 Tax=Candidatus Accumulibacter propinquus TaxID=2954380 RepID=UPI002FC2E888
MSFGASSELSGVSIEEVRFIAVRPAHGNDADCRAGFDVHNQHHQAIQKADADHALLAIVRPIFIDQQQRPGNSLSDAPDSCAPQATSRQRAKARQEK